MSPESKILIIEPDSTPKTPEQRVALLNKYQGTITRILKESQIDPYWTTHQALEDGETGTPPIVVVDALERRVKELRG